MVARNNKRLKANLKLRMFFVFLTFSFVFWMLIKLSKSYTTEVAFDVVYVNLPIDKVFQTSAIPEINATVISSGFNLLKYGFNRRKLQLDVSNLAYKKGSEYYYLPNNHLTDLRLQLNNESIIQRIYQDTIFIALGQNKTKKVPIELDADIQFELGYNFVEAIKITPDSIDIIGPEKVLDTIYSISTEKVKLINVSSAISKTVQLEPLNNNGLTFSTFETILTAEVDKFTEGSLTLSFEILNLPENYTITTFPKEVKVIYKVGLTNFSKITAKNMKVVCDFKQSQDNKLEYLTPQLQEQSSLISSVRFVPNKITFLIEE